MLFYVLMVPPGKFIWMKHRSKSLSSIFSVTTMMFFGRLIVSDLILRGVMMFSLLRLPFLRTRYTTVFVRFTYFTSEDRPSGKYTLCTKLSPSSETVVLRVNLNFSSQVLSVVEQFLQMVRPVEESTFV